MFNLVFVGIDKFKKANHSISVFALISFLFIFLPFCMVVYFSLVPSSQGNSFSDNVSMINVTTVLAIVRSLYVAFVTVVVVFLLSYPFAYFIASISSKSAKAFLMIFISSPLWSSSFVKLLGIKSFLDLLNGNLNSTYGIIYTIIGLVYLNLPVAIFNFFNVLNGLPKNLINASLDLGFDQFSTILEIVIPYTKEAIISGIFLIFLPSFTAVTASEFLNNENGSKLIGQIMNTLVYSDNSTSISQSRISMLTLFILALVFIFYYAVKAIPGIISCIRKEESKKHA